MFALQIATNVIAERNGLCFISTDVCVAHNEWSGNHDDPSYAVSAGINGYLRQTDV